jgi:hypothetical protein
MHTRPVRQAALILIAAIVAFGPLGAQDHANLRRGINGPALYDFGFGQLDAVNLFNGQLSIRLPIASYRVNGNLDYTIALHYSSNILNYEIEDFQVTAIPNPHANAGAGWMLFTAEVYAPFASPVNDTEHWLMVRGDGSRHLFYDALHEGEAPATSYRYTRDGSYLRMHCTASSGNCVPGLVSQIEIESPDGLVFVFEDDPTDAQLWQRGRLEQIRDRFFNTINFTYGSTTVTISDGHRTTAINFDPGHGQVSSVEVPAFDGTTATYDFSYGDAVLQGTNPTPVKVLESVALPDGSAWTMGYEPAPDDPLIERLTLPTGGAYEWDYDHYSFPGTTQLPSGLTLGVIEKRALGTTGTEIGR